MEGENAEICSSSTSTDSKLTSLESSASVPSADLNVDLNPSSCRGTMHSETNSQSTAFSQLDSDKNICLKDDKEENISSSKIIKDGNQRLEEDLSSTSEEACDSKKDPAPGSNQQIREKSIEEKPSDTDVEAHSSSHSLSSVCKSNEPGSASNPKTTLDADNTPPEKNESVVLTEAGENGGNISQKTVAAILVESESGSASNPDTTPDADNTPPEKNESIVSTEAEKNAGNTGQNTLTAVSVESDSASNPDTTPDADDTPLEKDKTSNEASAAPTEAGENAKNFSQKTVADVPVESESGSAFNPDTTLDADDSPLEKNETSNEAYVLPTVAGENVGNFSQKIVTDIPVESGHIADNAPPKKDSSNEAYVAPTVAGENIVNFSQKTAADISVVEKDQLGVSPSTSVSADLNTKTDASIEGMEVESIRADKEQVECDKTEDTSSSSGNDPVVTGNLEKSQIPQEKSTERIPSVSPSPRTPEQIDSDEGAEASTSDVPSVKVGHVVDIARDDKENLTPSEISESHEEDEQPQTRYDQASVDESSNISSDDIVCMAHADLDENAGEPMDSTSQNEADDPFFCSKTAERDHDTLMEVDDESGPKIISVESHLDSLEDGSGSVDELSTDKSEATTEKFSSSAEGNEGNTNNDSTAIQESGISLGVSEPVEEGIECDVEAEDGNNDTQSVSSSGETQSHYDNEMVIAGDQTEENTDQQKSATVEKDNGMATDDTTSTSREKGAENEPKTQVENQKSKDDADVAIDGDVSTNSREGEENFDSSRQPKERSATKEKNSANPEDQMSAVHKAAEEVCIVPDTSPRTESEKTKGSEAAAQTSAIESKSSPATQTDETKGKLPSDTDAAGVGEKDQPSKISDGVTRKVGIHLVSTSSLVCRPDPSDKVVEENEAVETASTQEGTQSEGGDQTCAECGKVTQYKYKIKKPIGFVYLCEDACYTKYRKANDTPPVRATIRPRKLDRTFVHKCGQCSTKVDTKLDKSLTWETMDFCNEECLEKYQRTLGSNCANCKAYVHSASLGKYCVRFGYDMKQFCSAPCLEDFKKGLKVCSYCQKDISRGAEGFLAPVGDKGQFKDFCTQECMEKYEQMSNNTVPPEITHECAVCYEEKAVKVEVLLDSKIQKLCSDPCFAAFKFVNNIVADQCDMCKKYYDHDRAENFSVFYDEAPHSFCCKTCMNVYILAKRKIVPCSWCKVKKYNFDMIKKTSSGQAVIMMCSLHCLEMYQTAQPTGASKQTKCEVCCSTLPAQYHLTMSDASVHSFCSSNCVVAFQGKFPKNAVGGDKTPYPLGVPRRIGTKKLANVAVSEKETSSSSSSSMPVISSVTSLAPASSQISPVSPVTSPSPSTAPTSTAPLTVASKTTGTETVKTVVKQQFILRPPPHPEMSNCAVQVKPRTSTKGVSCRPHSCSVGTQTDDSILKPILIPIPVPIYIPTPMHMYSIPYPVPIPITLPIPVPFFIPTTRNSAKGIMKDIKRIQEKIPSDPYEAELLMMAAMVAGEKKSENTDSDSEDGGNDAADSDANDTGNAADHDFSPEPVDTNINFGDDVFKIALKMASDFDEPAVDFESGVVPTSTPSTQTPVPVDSKDDSDKDEIEAERITRSGKKRSIRTSSRSSSTNSKRVRKSSSSDQPNAQQVSETKVSPKDEPVEKPDVHMCLKFTLGVQAWKDWVNQKNAEVDKKKADSSQKIKRFKPELLQLTSDELNYYLCLFVKEVRKPNGQAYAPDTIYYLCLGIQQYLIENGRIENIFTDPYYEKFTDCLDEAAKQFPILSPETPFLVTRIEESHLWESKQLGAHSPYVLLNTLMFFNTKHFNLMTVEEHMQLSFSHIMKHWKRNPAMPLGSKGSAGTRNVLLRFYPPQSALAANSKKKKVYEQQENEENPLRCPVKLYEFYLSKCPESVKTRNDVFYLLPERSCVPDSPVWYSTMSLGHEQLQKMLHRIKMVKEIAMME